MRIRRLMLLAAAISIAAAVRVGAHAFLEHANPAVGSTVEVPPAALDLEFSEAIEPAFSSIEVVDLARGAKIEARPLEHPQPRSLSLPVPALQPGEYEVRWKVVSVDTHATEGTFKFRVAPR